MTRLRFDTPLATVELHERDGVVHVVLSRDDVRLLDAVLPVPELDAAVARVPADLRPTAANARRLGYYSIAAWAAGHGFEPALARFRVERGLPRGTTPEARAWLADARRGIPTGEVWDLKVTTAVRDRILPTWVSGWFHRRPERLVRCYLALLGFRDLREWAARRQVKAERLPDVVRVLFAKGEEGVGTLHGLELLLTDINRAIRRANRLLEERLEAGAVGDLEDAFAEPQWRQRANGAAHGSLEAEVV